MAPADGAEGSDAPAEEARVVIAAGLLMIAGFFFIVSSGTNLWVGVPPRLPLNFGFLHAEHPVFTKRHLEQPNTSGVES